MRYTAYVILPKQHPHIGISLFYVKATQVNINVGRNCHMNNIVIKHKVISWIHLLEAAFSSASVVNDQAAAPDHVIEHVAWSEWIGAV